jgi:hypothetical protein
VPPPGFDVSRNQAVRIADADPRVREPRAEHPRMRGTIVIPLYGDEGLEFDVYHWEREESSSTFTWTA